MRIPKKYKKVQGTRKQISKLNALNKFQDDIAKYYYSNMYSKKKRKNKS